MQQFLRESVQCISHRPHIRRFGWCVRSCEPQLAGLETTTANHHTHQRPSERCGCWKRTQSLVGWYAPHKSLLLSEGRGTTNDVWHLVATSVGQEDWQKLDENNSRNNNVCFIVFRLRWEQSSTYSGCLPWSRSVQLSGVLCQ